MRLMAIVAGVMILSAGWSAGLEPWASNTDPTDVARSHSELVTSGKHTYSIAQGGTMDGTNCRPPVGYAAWHQTWESNRAVRLENTGDTDVVNPWLSNGRNNFRTIEQIVAGALEPGMTDREKAIAVWRWEMNHRFHAYTADDEVNDPVKVFNVYGYTLCGNDAICISGLWGSAGLAVRPARPIGHCVTEVYYDGGWHLLDGDEHCAFLLRDNHTIASEAEIVRDHDLIKRTHTYGILSGDSRTTDEFSASLYIFDGVGGGTRDCRRGHNMNMRLRPGEAITWRWGHLVPYKFHGKEDIKDWGQNAIDKVCNGLWEYRPDLTGDLWCAGTQSISDALIVDGDVRCAQGQTGHVVWKIRTPYVIVGGKLDVDGEGLKWALSWDGSKWEDVEGNLDGFFPPDGPPRYEYQLRCELSGNSVLRGLGIINDIQMAPLSLPGMVVGDNQFSYIDETEGQREVRITHEWVERSASNPPAAPARPVFPSDGGETNGTGFAFAWEEPTDSDGDEIADYHFELSERADMKWPLSPNFEKLTSLTADKGKAQFTLPYVGLLTPGRTYYWRVRAKDAKGVWGPWSETWSFVPRGLAPPVNVRMDFDAKAGIGTLRWERNPEGSAPAKYIVYGSDERGFTVSDEPYTVNVGNQKEKLPTPFPANLVSLVAGQELAVVGAGLELPNANKAFYRVVAVDDEGNRSWSSDFVASPRPFIYTAPAVQARVGQAFEHEVKTIRSLGDLRCRTIGATPYNSNFWDIEKPAYELEEAPGWLSIDGDTGVLKGTPPTAGKWSVSVLARIADVGASKQVIVLHSAL